MTAVACEWGRGARWPGNHTRDARLSGGQARRHLLHVHSAEHAKTCCALHFVCVGFHRPAWLSQVLPARVVSVSFNTLIIHYIPVPGKYIPGSYQVYEWLPVDTCECGVFK